MKRILPLLVALLIVPTIASAETFRVTQDGSGADFSVAEFNSASNWGSGTGLIGPGDTVYFSGTITTQVNPPGSGSPGNPVILDGYENDDCDPLNSVCSSSALLTGGLHINNGIGYITIQDFRMTDNMLKVRDEAGGTDSSYITIQRNYLYDMDDRLFMLYGTTDITVENNKMVNYGGVYDTSGGVYFKNSNNVIFRGNQFGNEDGWASKCTSDNIFEVHNNDHILWEYNEIFGANVQSGIAIKEYGNNDIIIRFNKIHDHGSYTDATGINIGYNAYNVYVYGNFIYNTYSRGIGIKDGAHDAHIWSNIIVGQGLNGIYSWFESGRVPGDPHVGDIFIFNNIIARNGGAQTDWTGMNHHDGELYVKNNIFWNNRPGESSYSQIYVSGDDTFQALEHNTYYHSGGAANFYYDGSQRSLATMQNTYNFEDDVPIGKIANPGFTNPSSNDFTLDGSNVNDGEALNQCFNVTVQGQDYHMCLSDALHPSTDWSASPSPSTIITANQSDYGVWERGAYVYTGGQSPQACSDGTPYGTCVPGNPPQYCDISGQLVNSCGAPGNCGCPSGQACSSGTCQAIPPDPDLIPQGSWTLLYADSEETSGEDGAAVNAFDGDPDTFWHTKWSGDPDPPHPHEIQISLGGSYDIHGFRYLPRQDGVENGMIGDYELYVSTDGSGWGSPVAQGSFTNSTSEQEAAFQPVTGSFIRLVALSEVNGGPWTSVAEISVLGNPASQPVHRADTSGDGCVDNSEILAFIDLWYLDSTEYPMGEMMEAVALWYSGC